MFMKSSTLFLLGWLVLQTCLATQSTVGQSLGDWEQLPPLPNPLGVAGPFAGAHNGVLLVAGGANFPDQPPWKGGTKVWYDDVFVLEEPTGKWRRAGSLPRPLGYGVSLSTNHGVVCLGGSDAQQHYADFLVLKWHNEMLQIEKLPPLPTPCANACGAAIGTKIFVAGGIELPTSVRAMRTFWTLDLAATTPTWESLEPWPGPSRMLAMAAADSTSFYLFSGTDLHPDSDGKPSRTYLRDAYRWQAGFGWERLPDLPRSAVAAPSPAPWVDSKAILVLGGDDGANVAFEPKELHPGFPKSILRFRIDDRTWSESEFMPISHVTTSAVSWNSRFVIPSGEVRPGVRSAAVWALRTP